MKGRLRQDSWDDKDSGKKRSKVEVVATDVTFLDPPSGTGGEASGSSNAQSSSKPSKEQDVTIEDIDDKPIDLSEIPF